jgi:taurine transport system permease protein
MERSLIEFDHVQKKEQGNLRLIDIFLFPSGTIMSSGPNCSEQVLVDGYLNLLIL